MPAHTMAAQTMAAIHHFTLLEKVVVTNISMLDLSLKRPEFRSAFSLIEYDFLV
jgi:hypothetical protein